MCVNDMSCLHFLPGEVAKLKIIIKHYENTVKFKPDSETAILLKGLKDHIDSYVPSKV